MTYSKRGETPVGPISDMSTEALISQEDRARTYNLPNDPKFATGKEISKKSLSGKGIELDKFADMPTEMWGGFKTESAVCKKPRWHFFPQIRTHLTLCLTTF